VRGLARVPLLALLAALPLYASDAPPRDPAPSPFPVPLVPVPPAPPPAPGGVVALDGDALYVVDAKADAVLRAHPAGLVTVTKETGPIRVRGKFAGGSGKVETRTFAGPCVYVLEAVPGKSGRLELDLIPLGFKAEADILAAAVDVNGGAPAPPAPGPAPAPPGPAPGPVTSFRVCFVWESATTPTAAQAAVLYGKTVRDFLNARTTKEGALPGYRVYDPQANVANEQPTMKALWEAVKPKLTTIPCMVVETNGKADILPFPASQEEAVAIFKKYLGEK
jgi:hypothetical protein